jgi:hypothetical protein
MKCSLMRIALCSLALAGCGGSREEAIVDAGAGTRLNPDAVVSGVDSVAVGTGGRSGSGGSGVGTGGSAGNAGGVGGNPRPGAGGTSGGGAGGNPIPGLGGTGGNPRGAGGTGGNPRGAGGVGGNPIAGMGGAGGTGGNLDAGTGGRPGNLDAAPRPDSGGDPDARPSVWDATWAKKLRAVEAAGDGGPVYCNEYEYEVATQLLTLRNCTAMSTNTMLSKTLKPGEVSLVEATLDALKVVNGTIPCGPPGKAILTLQVERNEGPTTVYSDSFYSCRGGGPFVDNLDRLFKVLGDLTR